MNRFPATPGRPRGETGSATVWVLAAGLVVVLAAAALATVGSATVARHRAQAAADLSALAAAQRAVEGEPAACARAAEVSALNGARLVACRLDGLDMIVTVDVRLAGGAAWGAARASARAGPVE